MLSMVILMIWGFNEKGDEMTREQAKIAHLVTDRAMLSSKNVKLEEQVKREKRKSRSIVAMLFWMMKRQKAIYIKSFNELGINSHNTSFYKGAYENSKMRFKQVYKMLKDNA